MITGISSEKWRFRVALLLFILLATALLEWVGNDLRPRSLYDYQIAPGYAPCPAGSPIIATVWLPVEKQVSAVRYFAGVPGSFPLVVTAIDQPTGRQLATKIFWDSGMLELPLPAAVAGSKVLELRFESKALTRETAPCLALATQNPPNWHMRLQPAFPNPLFLSFEFDWPTKKLLWIWALLPPAFCLAWRRSRMLPLFLLVLGLCCTTASVMLWQRDYSQEYEHRDADEFAKCAQVISDYAVDPGLREIGGKWLKERCRPLNFLGSALASVLMMMDMPMEPACLLFSALCGFGALLVFIRILGHLQVSERVRLVSVALFALHWLHLRSFSRVISDEFGLFLVTLMLYLLMNRIKAVRRLDSIAIAVLLFAMPLSRPPGTAFALFLLLGVVACDAWREKKFTLRHCLRTFIGLAAIPLLLIAALFIRFNWGANYLQSIRSIHAMGLTQPKWLIGPAIIGVFQWFPLVWACGKKSIWKSHAVVILVVWLLFYLTMLAVANSGLPARFLVPVLPVLAGLSAAALEYSRERSRFLGWGLVWLAIFANAGAVFYQIFSIQMDESVIPFITSW